MENKELCLEKQPLSQEMLEKMDAYWRATNYLSAGQLYLLDNPLLKEPLAMEHIKKNMDPIEAIEKASGKYGRFDEAVKVIDPREE